MSGNKFLLDTNTILYLLGGKLNPQNLPDGKLIISFINELELLSYPHLSKVEEIKIKKFIDDIDVFNLTDEIKVETIRLRKKYNIKLPDAIICATALSQNAALITFDENLNKIKELKILKLEYR
ncbi:MAG: type II toxin-antitoxin system VapC family toxin [Ignavibacteria bacterium]|nr:type II toxin-antitoxin system VapC family toxin [Ignavibacteria bacterium]